MDRLNTDPEPAARPAAHPTRGGLAEVVRSFSKLGLISFGGPVAHLGYMRAEFVERRRWIADRDYADLVALCQFLPGPASSQVVFALGLQRTGLAGGLLASFCFTFPSALLLIGFAYGVARLGDLSQAGWLHGLKLAAVAVVAQAVWGMGRSLCPDRTRFTLCLAAAALLLVVQNAWVQVGVIFGGGIIGWLLYRKSVPVPDARNGADGAGSSPAGRRWVAPMMALGAFFLFLVLLPVLKETTGIRAVAVFDSFFRAGSLVFGGGHVVLPLLHAEVVPPGWVSDDQFLAGYGAAQAIPGPLFTFAGYLGAIMQPGAWACLNGLWALVAIFLPAWLLIGGALPFWHRLRARPWARAALFGANAAVVGILLAALYHPVITSAVHTPADLAAALLAFGALVAWKTSPWAVVLMMAAVGQWGLG